ncbi:MAG: amino acid ABC transporter substrate-binding protein [Nitrospinaceae bacterium]|nr:MAG: amino acid ABC transporter substrate-binding protein [Nitrospinaceae bacterium]
MNVNRNLVVFFIAFFLAVIPWQPVRSAEADSSANFQKILKTGTLRVGVSFFTPWVFKDKKGELAGFEIDVAKKLAKDMGLTARFVPHDWDRLIPALLNDEIDIIIAGMAITPYRALKVNFSQPYATAGVNLATNLALTKDIKSLKEINQKKIKIGVVAKTVAEDLARKVFEKALLKTYKTSEEVKADLISGKIHVYLESKPIPQFLALEHPDKIDVPLSKPLLTTKAGFAIKKGDPDFLNFLNSWIIARETDTWLKSIHDFWFTSLKWRQKFIQ